MSKIELKLTALKIALDRGRTDGIDMVLEIAEIIYSYLIKYGVDKAESDYGGWAHRPCPNSNCRKVFE